MDNREIRLSNLRYAIKFFGGTATLAEASGCSKKYLDQIVQGFQSGKDKNPRKLGDTVAAKIAQALGHEPYWMDQPHPELWEQDDAAHTLSNITRIRPRKSEEIIIRQYETGGAMGAGLELRDQPGIIHSWSVNQEWLQKNVKSHTAAKNLCIVTGFGDSMRPMFNPGDPLIVDTGVVSVDFDAVYFFRVGAEGFIKRLQRIPTPRGTIIRAKSENKKYDAWDISADMDLEVFGRVLKVWCSEDF